MIEINLLPGSVKRAPRRALPRFGGGGGGGLKMPRVDRTMALVVALPLLAVGIVAWLHFSTSNRLNELRAEEEAAVRDSARYAVLRTQGDSLRAQVDIISQKLEIIQSIDAGRFVWPHIVDEVSRALPPYVWLTAVSQSGMPNGMPRVLLEGNAGSYSSLGTFIRELENSPFLRASRLLSSMRAQVAERTVFEFVIEVDYQEPPPDVIQTVPLFAATDQAAQTDQEEE